MPTNHGAFEWIKVPDKNNPGQVIKKWVRDSWSRRKILDLQTEFMDKFNSLFQLHTYSYGYELTGYGGLGVTRANLGMTVPAGYTPLGFFLASTGNNNVVFRALATTQSQVAVLRNLANSAQSGTVSIGIIYVSSSYINQI